MAQLVFKRTEVKYLLDGSQAARLMQEMVLGGRMAPDPHGPSTICNVYLDTPSHLLIRRSLEHPSYKEKLRVRSYGVRGVGDRVFFELKKKCDGIVYKRRATLRAPEARALLEGVRTPQGQIERELDFSLRRYGGIRPAVFIAYDREAFYAADDRDFRMTFDRRVRSRWDHLTLDYSDAGEQLLPDSLVLLEVKTSKAMPLWLADFLAKERIFKARWSKYGNAYMAHLRERKLNHA